ncbi:NAD-dependent epimerase/dehydratase family protein [Chitinophaga sp. Hz27]|uniref:NAD-dependent epimerase/dehydratase family protein n=1 Tax=Chitinophaga sp. Hz27 TaxID=3347169 RepID=UPI0035D7F17D
MQTILGSSGQIAIELAKALKANFSDDIRLVSRNPHKVNDTDTLFRANLLDAAQTDNAVQGSEIAYLTVGLPMDTKLWEQQFPVMMKHVITACQKYQVKLVFFDNTYMYPQDNRIQTEDIPFEPVGRKGRVRAQIANMLLHQIAAGNVNGVICRAPEFYGPGKTQSITNTLIFDKIRTHKTLRVMLRDDTNRSLIWTPDAARATALIGNTPAAFNQTWHLPCTQPITYKSLIKLAEEIYGRPLPYSIIPKWLVNTGAVFSKQLKELQELLPRYTTDNYFDSTKFQLRFPDFHITDYKEGVSQLKRAS